MKHYTCSDLCIYAAAAAAVAMYPGHFVYRGGSHIAVSRANGDDRRLIFAPGCAMTIREDDLAGITSGREARRWPDRPYPWRAREVAS